MKYRPNPWNKKALSQGGVKCTAPLCVEVSISAPSARKIQPYTCFPFSRGSGAPSFGCAVRVYILYRIFSVTFCTILVISTKCGVAARMEKSINKARFLHSLTLGRNDIINNNKRVFDVRMRGENSHIQQTNYKRAPAQAGLAKVS